MNQDRTLLPVRLTDERVGESIIDKSHGEGEQGTTANHPFQYKKQSSVKRNSRKEFRTLFNKVLFHIGHKL